MKTLAEIRKKMSEARNAILNINEFRKGHAVSINDLLVTGISFSIIRRTVFWMIEEGEAELTDDFRLRFCGNIAEADKSE